MGPIAGTYFLRAVAVNQPANKNRMGSTKDLAAFAAKLREFMVASTSYDRGCGGMENAFNQLALELFPLQFRENIAYGKFCAARGATPEKVRNWRDIPAVPTIAFKELDLTCLPKAERTAVFHSSGTTRQRPSRHFHSQDSLNIYEHSLARWFRVSVLCETSEVRGRIPLTPAVSPSDGERGEANRATDTNWCPWGVVILTPPPAQAPDSSLVHMFEAIRRVLSAEESVFVGKTHSDGAWRVDTDRALELLSPKTTLSKKGGDFDKVEDNVPKSEFLGQGLDRRGPCPALILGTAFSFVHMLDDMAEHQIVLKLPPGSRAIETGGYKGRSRSLPKAELHSLISSRLGIPATHILSEYGMSELSSQAYDLVLEAPLSGSGDSLHATSEVRGGALTPTLSPSGAYLAEWARPRAQQRPTGTESSKPHGAKLGEAAAPGNGRSPAVQRLFRFPPWVRTQVVSPETGREVGEGETGLLRVFDLANVYSVMAIQTEDLAVRRGDAFELLGRNPNAEPRGCSLREVEAHGKR